ncbi:hypothetical protein ANN_03518 [Periplaneta americana]|uniref:Uncharacterized protein n=1 Tax=Periplaneta americana TaxID=6978 RepID=A0ABQ8TZ36_PERAM|nr:hypothetical protein ANN_03518 [Periplaneta americana]
MAGLCEGGNEPPGSLKANSGDEDYKDSDRAQLQAVAELVTDLLDIVQPYNEEGGTDIRKDSDLISNEIDNSPPSTRRINTRFPYTSYNGWGDHHANHTWLDDRPPLLRHVGVRPAAGWSV